MALGRKAYFLTVAETGNITKAAQILHISQPSLSQYITRLERDLGVRLFNRNYTPLILTEAGKLYLEYIQELASTEEQFGKDLDRLKRKGKDTLSLGVPTQTVATVFKKYIEAFIRTYPDINVSIFEGTSSSMKQMLINDEIDIAFFHTRKLPEEAPNCLVVRTDELFWVCNPNSQLVYGHQQSTDPPVVLSDMDITLMEKMRFLMLPKGYHLHDVMLEHCREMGISIRRYVQVPSIAAISDTILRTGSDGVSLLPRSAFDTQQISVSPMFFRIKHFRMPWYLTMNYLNTVTLSGAAEVFWNYMSHQLKDGQETP